MSTREDNQSGTNNNTNKGTPTMTLPAIEQDSWINKTWRPAMAVVYMITCVFDFIVAPILWSYAQIYLGLDVTQWNPLTLQGAGLYHMAMGAVLGVTAWTRGQERLQRYQRRSDDYDSSPRREERHREPEDRNWR